MKNETKMSTCRIRWWEKWQKTYMLYSQEQTKLLLFEWCLRYPAKEEQYIISDSLALTQCIWQIKFEKFIIECRTVGHDEYRVLKCFLYSNPWKCMYMYLPPCVGRNAVRNEHRECPVTDPQKSSVPSLALPCNPKPPLLRLAQLNDPNIVAWGDTCELKVWLCCNFNCSAKHQRVSHNRKIFKYKWSILLWLVSETSSTNKIK